VHVSVSVALAYLFFMWSKVSFWDTIMVSDGSTTSECVPKLQSDLQYLYIRDQKGIFDH
jgi:hypothetical protein